MCIYVDVMLGRSCSSMLQNDLVLIEREKKERKAGRRGDKVGTQWEDEQVHWFCFVEMQKKKRAGLHNKDGQREVEVVDRDIPEA